MKGAIILIERAPASRMPGGGMAMLGFGVPALAHSHLTRGPRPGPRSRPGQWGRGGAELPDHRVVYAKLIDLITGTGIAGQLRSQQRSVPNLLTGTAQWPSATRQA